MWVNATEDLSIFIPRSGTNGGHTQVDVSSKGIPRLFDDRESAAKALGHWFNGPYEGFCEDDGWHYNVRTDANRRLVWGEKLAPREVKLVPVGV